MDAKTDVLTRGMVLAMALTCGFAAANLWMNQPMMAAIARGFGLPEIDAWIVPTATQVGYAAGLLLLAPLGDRFERRSLILALIVCLVACLVLAAFAPTLRILAGISFLIGMFSVLAQVVVPMAAQLASPERRGHIVGTVMAGLLIGILGARVVSGFVAEMFGWRSVYGLAALLMFLIAVLVRSVFPRSATTSTLTYPRLILSPWVIFKEEPLLREASCVGALLFASFSLFWSTLTLYLDGPAFHVGPLGAGLFGLVGIVGALAAPLAGKLADGGHARRAVGAAALIVLASFVIFGLLGAWISGLVLGVILLDLGMQAAQISNQARIYTLRPDARSRITTVYIGLYFVGGSLGSALGAIAWRFGGWPGVCIAGAACCVAALAVHVIGGRRAVAASEVPAA